MDTIIDRRILFRPGQAKEKGDGHGRRRYCLKFQSSTLANEDTSSWKYLDFLRILEGICGRRCDCYWLCRGANGCQVNHLLLSALSEAQQRREECNFAVRPPPHRQDDNWVNILESESAWCVSESQYPAFLKQDIPSCSFPSSLAREAPQLRDNPRCYLVIPATVTQTGRVFSGPSVRAASQARGRPSTDPVNLPSGEDWTGSCRRSSAWETRLTRLRRWEACVIVDERSSKCGYTKSKAAAHLVIPFHPKFRQLGILSHWLSCSSADTVTAMDVRNPYTGKLPCWG